ncbi:diacylglycerol/lipid kinase family protein [Kitasatospora cinereorecta]|uniref:Diacylglycerol/lipid kinase family protein n=1 Tax=Kitasatospora cinereorecta TaxID=285560 RepID=A0ABW0V838_9ACTN
MTTSARGSAASARRLARLALLCALAALVVLIAGAGLRSPLVVLAGLAAVVLAAIGVWWILAHRGPIRLLGFLLAVGAPIGVIVLYAGGDLWPEVLASMALWGGGLASARQALRHDTRPRPPRIRPSTPPQRPALIMNPKSGGGKVEKFDLVAKAEALGARVILLDTSTHQDVTTLARQALADGADLLGVAGGDGTQALVAAVAAEHGVPFMVIAAGTRNHFAMDLGLDRADPSRSLDALTDGVELRIDLGEVAGRPFVNLVSFGPYAEIVQKPEYRDAKAATALAELPDLLLGYTGARLSAEADGTPLGDPQALLVSNNPYAMADLLAAGRRPRLDGGVLGVVGLKVTGAAQAADLALRGERSDSVRTMTAHEVVVTADGDTVAAGVDGEALTLDTPVRCTIRPGALRIRVPRNRPGVPPAPPTMDWRRIRRLAFGPGDDSSQSDTATESDTATQRGATG